MERQLLTAGGLPFVAVKNAGYTNSVFGESYEDSKGRIICVLRQKLDPFERKFDHSGMPESFLAMTFEAYDADNAKRKKAKSLAESYVSGFQGFKNTAKNSILLCGQVGSGKTHLAAAVAMELMQQGCNVTFLSYRQTITHLKWLSVDECDRATSDYINSEILFIDDLYEGKGTEADANFLKPIIDERMHQQKPTIFTTEKYVNDLVGDKEMEGVNSRMISMCKTIVQMEGQELNYRYKR